uniref:helix-turn-helix domain-containing protein n=1 Tax=Methylosinus sp. Ce-a6 TaxID=2172005 RepID=UPI001359D8D5
AHDRRLGRRLPRKSRRRLKSFTRFPWATFALALNVSKILVSKWERGETRPSGPSLKLLALADRKGIEAIL